MRRFIFADEAGCFAFEHPPKGSRYFIVCTVTLEEPSWGDRLLELRRRLAWEGAPLRDYFHASEDKQVVRDAVFNLLAAVPMQIAATILEKRKAQPQIRPTKERF